MKKFLLSCVFLSLAAGHSYAQAIVDDDDYVAPPVAAGFRASPDGAGLSGRYFFKENLAVEAQVNFSAGTYYDNGTSFTIGGLFEYFILLGNPRWRIFVGAGPHYGRWSRYRETRSNPVNTIGIDAIVGVEYILRGAPIGLSFDYKPALQYVAGVTYLPNNGAGLGVRYYFGRWPGSAVSNGRPESE